MIHCDIPPAEGGTDFYRRVEIACGAIPYGRVATYGQIALLCGKPNNARQVGYALNRRTKREVPAHRVVDAKGFLSGAGAFAAPGMQRSLLEAEGIAVAPGGRADGGRVDLGKYGWRNTLEEAILLREQFDRENI